jgi:dolichol-phosphate mannosyltransferase
MSRRFGVAECVMAGLEFSSGAAVVVMDADLQDPPELIPTLVDRWREGADVVYTVRTRRQEESAVKSFMTKIAYFLIRGTANIDLPVEAGSFQLLNRRVVDEVLKLPERTPYLRGLIAWVGFRRVPVYYERQARHGGRSHFPFFSVNPWREFLAGFTSFSSAPIVMLLPLGLAIGVAALCVAAIISLTPQWRLGMTAGGMIGLVLVALCGLQLAGLGLIGVYIGRIADDVRGRPRYIVDSVIGGRDDSRTATREPVDRA